MSDTIEPTEAEAVALRWIQNYHVPQSQALYILRAHVAAEVAKATGELLNDKERLDWLCGEDTDVAVTPVGQSWKVRTIWAANQNLSWRDAIDAARAQQKDTP